MTNATDAGDTSVDLIAVGGAQNVSTSGESNLADVYCQALLSIQSPGLNACLINGGSFKANIPAGKITKDALQAAYPYNDT